MDPKDLIKKAKNGDNEAFGKLYETYYVPVLRYIYFRIKKKEDTQDLVQVVFLKVYESVEKYEDRGKDPLSYFFTVARNTVIDYQRKKPVLKLYEETQLEGEEKYSPEYFARINEETEIVDKAIKTLKGEQKEVILLKYIAGFSNSEIAKQIGKSEDSVRQIQHRALKILKGKLQKLYE